MDIRTLKAGETGYGYLIEQDAGYISPSDDRNKQVIREFEKVDHHQGTQSLIVIAVLQKFNVKNRNGRIYTEAVLRSQNEVYQQAIRERRAVGEMDHPESTVISGDRISHNILQTWWEGHTLMGKVEILMTKGYQNYGIVSTKGDHVAELLRHDIMIGVSSRGIGSLKEIKGNLMVQDDYEIICWDVVTAPSTPGSWMFKNIEDAKPYIENTIVKKPSINEGLDSFLID